MIPTQIQAWLKHDFFPQRILLSGQNNGLEIALNIAAQLQAQPLEQISQGLHADTLVLKDEGQSFRIGADQNPEKNSARGVVQWVSQSPVAPHRIVILEHFERASRESPQALLKVIEEPPPKAIFIFTTDNHHKLLDTIISRMTVVRLETAVSQLEIKPEITDFLESQNLILKFRHIDDLSKQVKTEGSSQPIKNFLEQLILQARTSSLHQKRLEEIFKTQIAINQNVNAKLALERLAILLTNN